MDEQLLGGLEVRRARSGNKLTSLIEVKQMNLGASAGPGSLVDDEFSGSMAFGPKWLKQMGSDPAKLSLISVDGDSMDPTLCNGDDIMVDHGAAEATLRDGIYVLRTDDVLAVKRIAIKPGAKQITVASDNPAYPTWNDMDRSEVHVVGRVIWFGRAL